ESKLAFVSGATEKSLWYFQQGRTQASLLVNHATNGIKPQMHLNGIGLKFTPKGDRLFFNVTMSRQKPNPAEASVDIWNYNDERLQDEQLQSANNENNQMYISVLDLVNNHVNVLSQSSDYFGVQFNDGDNSDFFSVTGPLKKDGRRQEKKKLYIVNTKTGSRDSIEGSIDNGSFSPLGKYAIWYDGEKKAYYTYNLKQGIIRNITKKIKYPLFIESADAGITHLQIPYPPGPIWQD